MVATIEIRIAPFTLRTQSATTSTNPKAKTTTGQPVSTPVAPSCTGTVVLATSGIRVTKPASTKPIKRDEEADADRDGRLQGGRYGVEDRGPEPGQDQDQDDDSLDHHQAHGVGPRHLAGDRERHERVESQPRGQGQRVVGHDAHQDRHHTGDQRGARRDGREVRAVPGAAAEEVAVDVGCEAEDQRVEDDDVAHREEGDEPATDLTTEGRSPLGDLEEAVEAGLATGSRLGAHALTQAELPGGSGGTHTVSPSDGL